MKGQTSVEFIVILAVSLVAIMVLYSFTATHTLQISAQQRVQAGQTALDSITLAANDVFFQGNGAKKRVYVIIPEDVNASASLISGSEVNLRIGSTDVFSTADVNIVGSLPTAPGGHYLTLVAHENYVSIGDTSLQVSKNAVYLAMAQDGNASTTLTLTNNSASELATVSLVKTWNHSVVSFALSSTSLSLQPGASQVIDFNFASNSTATGNYAGSVKVNADFNVSLADENLTVPVNVDVTPAQTPAAVIPDTNLLIVPSTWKRTINRGTIDSNTFQVCNNSSQAMAPVSFTKSTGDAGAWVYDINSISSLGDDSCTNQSITLSIPGSASEQTATGTLTSTGNGSQDTIALTITVVIPSSYALYTPSTGYDATDEGETLSAGDLSDLDSSDNSRYSSDDTWPKNASTFDDARYIEYSFAPVLPSGSTIQDVNLVHEYSLSGSATVQARLRVWDADASAWSNVSLSSATGSTDVTDTLSLNSIIDSANAVNNFKVRFQLYASSNNSRRSRHDLISLGVKYKPP